MALFVTHLTRLLRFALGCLFCLFLILAQLGGASTLCAQQSPGSKQRVHELARAYTALATVGGEDSKGQSVGPFYGFFVANDLVATDFRSLKEAIKIQVQTASGERKEANLVGVDPLGLVALLQVPKAD